MSMLNNHEMSYCTTDCPIRINSNAFKRNGILISRPKNIPQAIILIIIIIIIIRGRRMLHNEDKR